ncbi:hypothetical protein ACFRLW_13805 [Streptomyces sp. NPDC056728]
MTAIELWWPGEGRVSSTRVLLDEDEVFITPAPEFFARAVGRGWRVDTSQPEYPVIPGVSLAFTGRPSGTSRGTRTGCHAVYLGPRRRQGLLRLPLRVIGRAREIRMRHSGPVCQHHS